MRLDIGFFSIQCKGKRGKTLLGGGWGVEGVGCGEWVWGGVGRGEEGSGGVGVEGFLDIADFAS